MSKPSFLSSLSLTILLSCAIHLFLFISWSSRNDIHSKLTVASTVRDALRSEVQFLQSDLHAGKLAMQNKTEVCDSVISSLQKEVAFLRDQLQSTQDAFENMNSRFAQDKSSCSSVTERLQNDLASHKALLVKAKEYFLKTKAEYDRERNTTAKARADYARLKDSCVRLRQEYDKERLRSLNCGPSHCGEEQCKTAVGKERERMMAVFSLNANEQQKHVLALERQGLIADQEITRLKGELRSVENTVAQKQRLIDECHVKLSGSQGTCANTKEGSEVAEDLGVNEIREYREDDDEILAPVPKYSEPVIVRTWDNFQIALYSAQEDQFISSSIISEKRWEHAQELMMRAAMENAPSNSIFVDIGANVGYFSLSVASQGHEVVAIEPMPRSVHLLERSLELNTWAADRITVIPKALGSSPSGAACMSHDRNNMGHAFVSSTTALGSPECIRVEMSTLDAEIGYLASVWALKVDVEGHELFVLEGGERLLSDTERKPKYIFLEVGRKFYPELRTDANQLYSFLYSFGYAQRKDAQNEDGTHDLLSKEEALAWVEAKKDDIFNTVFECPTRDAIPSQYPEDIDDMEGDREMEEN